MYNLSLIFDESNPNTKRAPNLMPKQYQLLYLMCIIIEAAKSLAPSILGQEYYIKRENREHVDNSLGYRIIFDAWYNIIYSVLSHLLGSCLINYIIQTTEDNRDYLQESCQRMENEDPYFYMIPKPHKTPKCKLTRTPAAVCGIWFSCLSH